MSKKIIMVGSIKAGTPGKRRPRIRISGAWLNQIGFEYGKLFTVSHESGRLVFKLREISAGNNSSELLENSLDLLQVRHNARNGKTTPHIEVKGYWLGDLGFQTGCTTLVQFEYGMIKVKIVDLDHLDAQT